MDLKDDIRFRSEHEGQGSAEAFIIDNNSGGDRNLPLEQAGATIWVDILRENFDNDCKHNV